MREYYVCINGTGTIVNCITTTKRPDEIDLSLWNDQIKAGVYLDSKPPTATLMKYRYWNERP